MGNYSWDEMRDYERETYEDDTPSEEELIKKREEEKMIYNDLREEYKRNTPLYLRIYFVIKNYPILRKAKKVIKKINYKKA
jgi:hypothetical protein